VKHEVNFVGVLFNIFEEGVDFFIARDITGVKGGVFTEGFEELGDIVFETLSLVVKNKGGSGVGPCFCDGPCDAAFVGDSEDDSDFSF